MTQDYRSKFYEWIREVRRTEKTIQYLEQKRRFYEERWMSIGGPSYDRTGGHSNDPFYVKGMYDFNQIFEIDKKLDELEKIIKDYNEFFDSLDYKLQLILTSIMFREPSMVQVSHKLKISRTMVYKLKEKMVITWVEKHDHPNP